MKQFASGAKSSEEAPRYDLVEPALLNVIARRMAQGAATHGVRNYHAGATDEEFLRDRINHMLVHAFKFAAGYTDDDHFAGFCAGANIVAYLLSQRE